MNKFIEINEYEGVGNMYGNTKRSLMNTLDISRVNEDPGRGCVIERMKAGSEDVCVSNTYDQLKRAISVCQGGIPITVGDISA